MKTKIFTKVGKEKNDRHLWASSFHKMANSLTSTTFVKRTFHCREQITL